MSRIPDSTEDFRKCLELLDPEENRPNTQERLADIKQRLLEGEPYRSIARDHGVSYQWIAFIAKAYLGINRREDTRERIKERREEIKRLMLDDHPTWKIKEIIPDATSRDFEEVRRQVGTAPERRLEVIGLDVIHKRLQEGWTLNRACEGDRSLAVYVTRHYPFLAKLSKQNRKNNPERRAEIIERMKGEGKTWEEIAKVISETEQKLVKPLALSMWWYLRNRHAKTLQV